jgi:lipopolysaccharide export system protein LptA
MIAQLVRSGVIAASAALALLAASPSPGPPPASGETTINGYRVETETTDWNANTGEFTMPKEVRVSRPGSDARGDRAHGNSKTGFFVLEGNVVAHDSGGAPEAREAGPDYQGAATLTADTLTIDSKKKLYEAQGNVHFTQGTRSGTARRGVLNQNAHTLHLEGDVLLADGETTFRAQIVDYNLQTKDVHSSGSPIVIRQPVPSPAPAQPTSSPAPRRR